MEKEGLQGADTTPLLEHKSNKYLTLSIQKSPQTSFLKSKVPPFYEGASKMPLWVITGANRGLGLEFVTQLSTNPSNTIIATTRTLTSDLTSLRALESKNSKVHILECDTGSESSIYSFAKQVTELLNASSETKIDFLLNNAGINSVSQEKALSMTAEGLNDQMRINVLGPAKIVENLLPHLKEGSVVMNMTSGIGSLAYSSESEMTKCTTYCISKVALNMLTVHQAKELRERGVTVFCMDPGWVKTRMGGEGAVLEKEVSIKGMLEVLGRVGVDKSGRFYEWNGVEKAW
ncbi:hypothetical protein G7Y89_g10478 [Cudoniella acicularis]|uniref:NAD(P)-binding protein n=1 Tax=Cudoniella acicularis TaxID=354080 RepID=A0A8H4RE90_9HELO|nr:hypothetical protein G7Y89_g10478 [Cudoniella acicularis]